MSRIKSIFAVLVLAAIMGVVPQAQATVTVEVTIAGSSAMWQSLALGAYALAGAGAGHWTSASNSVNLTDTRVTPPNNDAGTIWIVWNKAATKVWAFDKVDSVVGNRCYFAQPACTVNPVSSSTYTGTGSTQISTTLWGSDSALPATVAALFNGGTPVTVAATDIRPEDAAFAICRVNSAFGASAAGGTASDGLDGLGYNTNNAAGVCPAAGLAQANYEGSPILSGYPGAATTDAANVLSFNISGYDPINSADPIPAYTVIEVGATPVVFITARSNSLKNLTNATPQQLAKAFSGINCDASEFDGPDGDPLPAGGINIFLREPLSGTYNTTEATLMRHPTVYTATPQTITPFGFLFPGVLGYSMETNVYNTTNNAPNNPLAGQTGTCVAGLGARYRAIGTSEEVKSVQNSNAAKTFTVAQDGIGYTFFSYGNVSKIANSSAYGYITVNGVDPIFASYGPQLSTGLGYDPGQPTYAGTLPGAANLPAVCDISGTPSFPCAENQIWAGGLSYPNLRNGSYPAWSTLRLVSNGTALTNAKALVAKSQQFVVTSIPDYVPFAKTVAGGITDPGLLIVRSHYQQKDGASNLLGGAAVNCGTAEAGGDMGGWILPFVGGKTCPTTPIQEVQGNQGFQVRP
jgi:hypothetical protein